MQPTARRLIALVALAALGLASGLAAQSGASRAPGANAIQRPTLGFSLPVPAGWVEKPAQDAAAMIVQEGHPEICAIIFVQNEAAPSSVTDVLAKASVNMKDGKERKFISNKFDVVLGRPALIAVLEDQTLRYKVTLFPRDGEDTSQVYYAIMAVAPLAAFARAEPALDRIASGFQILPMAPTAPTTSRTGTATDDGFDRAKAIDRILAPRARDAK
jgi:hypothetical protein